MEFWKTAALSAALLGAGAAMAPPIYGQSGTRGVAAPHVELFTSGSSRIGVSVSDVDATKATGGVMIETVEEGSAAEKAGLKNGDVVVEFDGERVRSVRQFTRLVGETPSGRQVAAAVMRDGKRVTVNVEPREASAFRVFDDNRWQTLDNLREYVRPMPVPSPAAPRPPSAPRAPRPPALDGFLWSTGNQLGVTVNGISEQLKEYFGVKDGVLVASVTEGSAAGKAGVKAGDVIVSVNGSTIEDASGLRREMQRLDAGEDFTLNIVRDQKSMTLKGKAEPNRNRRMTTRTIL
ncbi:MAG: PDZ domain-containing protein [Acidobacteria bacterium]|nr:PDZ domain-containing protein [Acidobacteriota bacterium]